MVFCDNCGCEIRPTSKFCGSCGTPTELIEDTSKTRRSKPVQPRKKSREEELAEYEEEYLRAKLNLQPKSKKLNLLCEECGSKIVAKDMFCTNCGAKR